MKDSVAAKSRLPTKMFFTENSSSLLSDCSGDDEAETVRLTSRGRLLSNDVFQEFLLADPTENERGFVEEISAR